MSYDIFEQPVKRLFKVYERVINFFNDGKKSIKSGTRSFMFFKKTLSWKVIKNLNLKKSKEVL